VVTPDGATLLARWYRQPSSDSRAAVLYLHGGGMIVGSVPIFDGPVSRYVARTGVSMLSLEYRLAPEHPHPTPVEDAYAGLVWLAGHAAELGIDPGRIAVMGDSAGGGLAAGVAILSRDRKGPAVARQLLIYPMLDDRTTTPDPYIAPFAGWSYDDNATAWNALLGAGHEHREIDPSGRAGTAQGRSRPAAGVHRGGAAGHLPRRGHPVTRSPSAGRACRSNCTCTPACRTSTTPSPSTPTCRAARKATATACCGACDASQP
jgi:acetyl esterase/lipase